MGRRKKIYVRGIVLDFVTKPKALEKDLLSSKIRSTQSSRDVTCRLLPIIKISNIRFSQSLSWLVLLIISLPNSMLVLGRTACNLIKIISSVANPSAVLAAKVIKCSSRILNGSRLE